MRRLRRIVPIVSVIVLLLLLAPMSAYAEPEQNTSGSGCSQWYLVKPGDTLNKIAARYGTTATYLARLNGISNPNYIRSGWNLCVKAGTPPPPCGYMYTVKPGDMLWKIAQHAGLNTWYLANVNGIKNPDRIYSGQRLWIPCR